MAMTKEGEMAYPKLIEISEGCLGIPLIPLQAPSRPHYIKPSDALELCDKNALVLGLE